MRPGLRFGVLILVTCSVLTACDFFRELESAADAGETGDTGDTGETGGTGETDGETDGGPCDVLDDHCSDQDTLHSCNYETGEVDTYFCAALCGSDLINFSCIPTPTFQHACWCVSPGQIKIDTCPQLEQCLMDCGDPASACANGCFEQTDYQTIRLLGTLFSCADRACDELCALSPGECGSCLAAAQAGLWGDCGLQRSVCDADVGDEPWP